MPGNLDKVRPEHPSVGEGHGDRAAIASNTDSGGRMFAPNLLLPQAARAPGKERASAQQLDADGAERCSPPQHHASYNLLAPPGTVPPGGCIPYQPGGTVPPAESPLSASDGQPRESPGTSLVRQSITQPNPVRPPSTICPPAVDQGLPGMTAGQYTLDADLVYPRQPPEESRIAGPWVEPFNPEQIRLTGERQEHLFCQAGGWTQGKCEHNTTRWVRLPCKKRSCPVCGQLRRDRVAHRISYGAKLLGGQRGAAWFVGTFTNDLDKPTAVKIQGKFIRWIRRRLGTDVQYAATWETTESGRLHVNLLLAPWRFIPQAELSQAWQRFGGGKVVWIQRVAAGIGVEAAKSRVAISSYLGKFEQMVATGRAVCYSKGWPKLPTDPLGGRQGHITWAWRGELSWETLIFEIERDRDFWREISPGEWRFRYGEECSCFERAVYSAPRQGAAQPP